MHEYATGELCSNNKPTCITSDLVFEGQTSLQLHLKAETCGQSRATWDYSKNQDGPAGRTEACRGGSLKPLEIKGVCVCKHACVRLTNQSGQGAVRDGGRESNNNEVLVFAKLLHLYTLFRHHVQLLQGVGLLRVPDGPNHV